MLLKERDSVDSYYGGEHDPYERIHPILSAQRGLFRIQIVVDSDSEDVREILLNGTFTDNLSALPAFVRNNPPRSLPDSQNTIVDGSDVNNLTESPILEHDGRVATLWNTQTQEPTKISCVVVHPETRDAIALELKPKLENPDSESKNPEFFVPLPAQYKGWEVKVLVGKETEKDFRVYGRVDETPLRTTIQPNGSYTEATSTPDFDGISDASVADLSKQLGFTNSTVEYGNISVTPPRRSPEPRVKVPLQALPNTPGNELEIMVSERIPSQEASLRREETQYLLRARVKLDFIET